MVMVCGRYEGFDERIRDAVDEEVSIGDFVLTGGEYGALIIIDGLVRLLPGTVGNRASTQADSFSDSLLEHAHYTRPDVFRGQGVPPVLRSGDHAKIKDWRHHNALTRTRHRRPDLLMQRAHTPQDYDVLKSIETKAPKLSLAVACPSSDTLTFELDRFWELITIYDIQAFYLVVDDHSKSEQTRRAFDDWHRQKRAVNCPVPERDGSRKEFKRAQERVSKSHKTAQDALRRIHCVDSAREVQSQFEIGATQRTSSVVLYDPPTETDLAHFSPLEFLQADADAQYLIYFGVSTDSAQGYLSAVRNHSNYNGLSVSSACAVMIERLLGEA
jgi:hypothetical protein